ncbi:MAG: hypothetical protein V1793_15105 [Pseudomonadota bacterium]
MADTCICTLLYGRPLYYEIGRRAVVSMLRKTNFDIFLAVERGTSPILNLKPSSRLHIEPLLGELPPAFHRAFPFLLKFRALLACLHHTSAEQILLMDADTLIVADIRTRDVQNALNGHDFGMVEQTTITNSSMTRKDFLSHYNRHTLAWFDPSVRPPSLDNFRFYNSGVVLGKHGAFESLVDWAIAAIASKKSNHQVGNHMIADQDYFQYWTNSLRPDSCQTLPWTWNHCQHWDRGFPDTRALVLHFSNFCKGPDRLHQIRMVYYNHLLNLKTLLTRGRKDSCQPL